MDTLSGSLIVKPQKIVRNVRSLRKPDRRKPSTITSGRVSLENQRHATSLLQLPMLPQTVSCIVSPKLQFSLFNSRKRSFHPPSYTCPHRKQTHPPSLSMPSGFLLSGFLCKKSSNSSHWTCDHATSLIIIFQLFPIVHRMKCRLINPRHTRYFSDLPQLSLSSMPKLLPPHTVLCCRLIKLLACHFLDTVNFHVRIIIPSPLCLKTLTHSSRISFRVSPSEQPFLTQSPSLTCCSYQG